MSQGKTTQNIPYKIDGGIYPAVSFTLSPGQKVYSEAGSMSWMSDSTDMRARLKGIFKIFTRIITKERFSITEFTTQKSTSEVTFSSSRMGSIIPIDLEEGETLYCQKGSFLCADPDVKFSATLTHNLLGGLFGGEGLIWQKVTGPGTVFLELGGQMDSVELADGEVMQIDEGVAAAWQPTVKYKVQFAKGGPLAWIFAKEGLLLGRLEGPGTVLLQSLPAPALRNEIKRRLKKTKSKSSNKRTIFSTGFSSD